MSGLFFLRLAMSIKTKFALIIALLLWASAYVGIRAGLQEYTPEGLALLRYIVASIFMGIIYFRSHQRQMIVGRHMLALLAIGVIGIGIYNITLNYGELAISSGMASFITAQSPIITTILAMMFLGEELSVVRVFGFIVSIAGVALITLGEIGGMEWNISVACILLATLASGFYSVLQKPFLNKQNALEATTYVIWGGTIFLSFYTPQLHAELVHASLFATLTVVYLGIFPAALGYICWTYALTQMPVTRAASFLYFMPFAATLLGWLLLDEIPALLSVLGGLLAIFGVWLVNHSYRQKAAA